MAKAERYGTGDPVLDGVEPPSLPKLATAPPPPDNGVEYGKPVRRPAFPGMTAPSPRVVDATSGVPRVVPSAVNPAGIEGRTSALPPLPELTRIMAPNNAEYTREMTESGLRNVAARTTVPGKLGAGVAGAVGIGAGAVAASSQGFDASGALLLLGAGLVVSALLAPLTAAAAIRIANS